MFIFLLSADTSRAAKVSSITYPPQVRMEMLVADMQGKVVFQKAAWFGKPTFLQVNQWPGVSCDRAKNVLRIEWIGMGLKGGLPLKNIPLTLEVLRAPLCSLKGTLDLTELYHLQELTVPRNMFHGEICLTELPDSLRALNLSRNHLSGSLDFSQMPPRMLVLNLLDNTFTGSINITALPACLDSFIVSQNVLSGTLNFGSFPEKLRVFDVKWNKFSGVVHIPRFPPMMQNCILQENSFENEAVLGALNETLLEVNFVKSGVGVVVDSDGNVFDDDRLIFSKRSSALDGFVGNQ